MFGTIILGKFCWKQYVVWMAPRNNSPFCQTWCLLQAIRIQLWVQDIIKRHSAIRRRALEFLRNIKKDPRGRKVSSGGKKLLRVTRSFYVLKYFLYEGCSLQCPYSITWGTPKKYFTVILLFSDTCVPYKIVTVF